MNFEVRDLWNETIMTELSIVNRIFYIFSSGYPASIYGERQRSFPHCRISVH